MAYLGGSSVNQYQSLPTKVWEIISVLLAIEKPSETGRPSGHLLQENIIRLNDTIENFLNCRNLKMSQMSRGSSEINIWTHTLATRLWVTKIRFLQPYRWMFQSLKQRLKYTTLPNVADLVKLAMALNILFNRAHLFLLGWAFQIILFYHNLKPSIILDKHYPGKWFEPRLFCFWW